MRILVTGASGFLGSRLVAVLRERGHDLILVRHPSPSTSMFDQESDSAREIDLDLSEYFDVELLPQVDAVISLAQERDFRNFPRAANRTLSVNVGSNVRIWEWAARTGVRTIVHASSGGIYGSGTDLAFTEDSLPPPHAQNSFYLGTKLCAEVALRSFFPHFKSVIIVRPFFLYGPGQEPDKFVQRMVTNIAAGRPISLNGHNGLRTNPVYVDDAALLFADALTHGGSFTVNCAGSEIVSLRDLCDRISHRLQTEPNYVHVDIAGADCIGDTTLQFERFGIPKIPLDLGLEMTISGIDNLE